MEMQRGDPSHQEGEIQKIQTILRLRPATTMENLLPKTVKLGSNTLHMEPVLQLSRKVKRTRKGRGTTTSKYRRTHRMEAVFSMVRKIYGKPLGDPMEDLNVNLAIW